SCDQYAKYRFHGKSLSSFIDLDINFFQAARIEMPPRPLAPPGAAPISTIEFWIGAGVGAGANSRKERNAARTALYHKVYGNKALEQGDRQLHAGEGAAPVAADGELVAPQSGRQRAGHAETACGDAAVHRRQLVFAARIALVFGQELRVQDSWIIAAGFAHQRKRAVAALFGAAAGPALALRAHDRAGQVLDAADAVPGALVHVGERDLQILFAQRDEKALARRLGQGIALAAHSPLGLVVHQDLVVADQVDAAVGQLHVARFAVEQRGFEAEAARPVELGIFHQELLAHAQPLVFIFGHLGELA